MDPSISLSWLVVKEEFQLIDYERRGRTLTRIFKKIFDEGEPVELQDYLISKGYPSPRDPELDIIMPDLKLTEIVDTLWINRPRREYLLSRILEELRVRDQYDVIIVDTIPFFDRKYSVMISYAADKMLVPLRPTIIDVYRTQTMIKELPKATAMKESNLYDRMSLIFNMVRTSKQKANIETYEDLMRTKVHPKLKFFNSHIPYYISFSRIGTEEEGSGDRDRVKNTLRPVFNELSSWLLSG